MASRTPMLMLMAIVVLGIYVLPSVTARFAGSHTMEVNNATKIRGLACEKCHVYIIDELTATSFSNDVVTTHILAANRSAYVNSTGILNITTDGKALAIANRSACLLCHLESNAPGAGSVNQTHTRVVIRVCTDDLCHGSPATKSISGATQWNSTKLNITEKLTKDADVHSKFFNPLNDTQSSYGSQAGTNYTKGFFACLACHTHLGLTFNLSRPIMIGLNFTTNVVDGENMTGFTFQSQWINTSRNATVSRKLPGISIWE
ncbi:MAG: hypothetical protein ACE5PM_05075 [Candidatus Hydrothermarchaeales archaeon]